VKSKTRGSKGGQVKITIPGLQDAPRNMTASYGPEEKGGTAPMTARAASNHSYQTVRRIARKGRREVGPEDPVKSVSAMRQSRSPDICPL